MDSVVNRYRLDAMEVATALVGVSKNLSAFERGSNLFLIMERRSTRERIAQLGSFMARLGYIRTAQDFTCGRDEARNVFWKHPNVENIDYLVTCHSDYIAGAGAVDNASGAGVMASVACECMKRESSNVAFAAFDAEEKGLKGSKAFVDAYLEDLSHSRPTVINVDSVGEGKLVQLRSQRMLKKELALPLEQWTDSGLRTDADSFPSVGFTTATISSYDVIRKIVAGLWIGFKEPSKSPKELEAFSAGNVCNTEEDTIDALCEDTMKQAARLILEIVTDHG